MIKNILFITSIFFSSASIAGALEVTIISAEAEERMNQGQSFAGITVEPDRPVLRAVELALFESKTLLQRLGFHDALNTLDIKPDRDLREQLLAISPSSLVILDIPLKTMLKVAPILNELKLVSFNVRHSEPTLRNSLCMDYLFHAIPSDHMYFDALSQFLIFRGWRKVLVVRGPSKKDDARAETLIVSLKKFGASVVDNRQFSLSHHPDDRDKNNPEFLTGGASYDVVAVIDSEKDYGRYLQYSTRKARPVVGDVGLTPKSWHFALERYGAPQLNERYRHFKKGDPLSSQVSMTDKEFAAWSAVKLVTNSLSTNKKIGANFDLLNLLKNPQSQVDLYKGTRGSVRLWNHQIRQPILLATPDTVVAVAPMPKFLHPKHYVDTLGLDEPESSCQLSKK